ncbi:hypothetical protein [Sphingomonas oligophenolica]|uniref:Uncharacterized protein n=1 Tax=Sphingomonas oligophenolica TaxID=301154 RepID=A0A502CLV2_9SPHN|nr:hypothetical protein [Sphingomonas oligophenolica]TPG13530.1 hypothetical protein EAH84_04840 [Sphingomonas oligophenolica]
MQYPITITPNEILSILERLHPDSLLLVRDETGLDQETQKALWRKVAFSYDPPRRLATVEYLLLIMHQACEQERAAYLTKVFFPWIGIKRRLHDQVMRIIDDIARTNEIEAYSAEDAAHIATKVYRPLVSDVFDPYMTLLIATYAFTEGTFVDIETSNLGAQERSKAEVVESRIRQSGGPANLLEGYDPIVRNALSHAGSDGVLYEPGSILFRNIKRGPTPIVESRRWSHDDLHSHVIALIELVMSIDAAIEIFGIDSVDLASEREVTDRFVYHVLNREQRLALGASLGGKLKQLQTIETIPQAERLDLLGKILFLQCAERDIPCTSVAFNTEHKTCFVTVPVEAKPVSDEEIRDTVMPLIRYLVLARAVFGELFDRFVVDAEVAGSSVMKVALPAGPLDEYAAEQAGLVDLLGDAKIWLDGVPLTLVIDFAALASAEDRTLGSRNPRRGRPISN